MTEIEKAEAAIRPGDREKVAAQDAKARAEGTWNDLCETRLFNYATGYNSAWGRLHTLELAKRRKPRITAYRLFPGLADWELDFAIQEARPEGSLSRIPVTAAGPFCAADRYIMSHTPGPSHLVRATYTPEEFAMCNDEGEDPRAGDTAAIANNYYAHSSPQE